MKSGFTTKSQELLNKGGKKKTDMGAIITGAALGPVFSSCSPVYAYIIATVLPGSFSKAILYITSYILGLSTILLLVSFLGQKFIGKVRALANPSGIFQKAIAVIFIVVGVVVFTGSVVKIQTFVSEHTPFDIDSVSEKLIPAEEKANQDGVLNTKAYKAPQFSTDTNDPDRWINSKPLKLEELKGKVVLVDFWTYSCINCIRTQPFMRAIYDQYKDAGLEIVGVHAPEFAFEKVKKNVEKATIDAKLEYPIVLDNDFSTWSAYENNFWPSIYLIDAEGNVRRTHAGEGEYKETEEAIRALLEEAGLDVPKDTVEDDLAAVPVSKKQTPETYLGSKRPVNFGGSESLLRDKVQNFKYPTKLEKNHWALKGDWLVGDEIVTASGDSSFKFDVNAKDVYLVAGSKTPKNITIKVNGKLISETKFAGADVKGDSALVGESRLYKLVDFGKFAKGQEIELLVEEGIDLSVFTFGS